MLCYPHIARTATKSNKDKFDSEKDRECANADIETMFHSRTPEMFSSLSSLFMSLWRQKGEKGNLAADWFSNEYLKEHTRNWFVGSSLIMGSTSNSNPIESSFKRFKIDRFGHGNNHKFFIQHFLTSLIFKLLQIAGNEKGCYHPIRLICTSPYCRNILLLASHLIAVEGKIQRR